MENDINETGITPTGDRVLVRLFKVEERTSGGIVLPGQAQEKLNLAQTFGVVVAAGEQAKGSAEMSGIWLGDTVIFARYSGANVELPLNGETYRLMRAADIVAKTDKVPDGLIPQAARNTADVFATNGAASA